MKPNRPASSSDLENARASAQRLSREGEPVAPAESLGYLRFAAPGTQRRGPAAEAPALPPRPAPEVVEDEPEAPLETEAADESPSSGSEINFETSDPPAPAPSSADEMIEQLVSDSEEPSEPPPSWAQVLDNCLSVSQSRAGLIADARGRILAASDQLPKAKLEAIVGRLLQTLEGLRADPALPESSRSASVQLGAFWLTGLRVPLGPDHVSVGLLASTALPPDVLPLVDAEGRRGRALT